MFKIVEKNKRIPYLAIDRDYKDNVWFATNEKDFINKVKKISKINNEDIFMTKTPDSLLWDKFGIPYEDLYLDNNDPCIEDYQIDPFISLGHWYGWSTTLYRADFIEKKEGNFLNISDFTEIPIKEFDAYKAFLEFVSSDVMIEEINISNTKSTKLSTQKEIDAEIEEKVSLAI